MKKVILFIISTTTTIGLFAQPLVEIMIDFNQSDSRLTIDTTLNENIWEIGIPQKEGFDSAYSIPNAICTSLDSNYVNNNYSSFQIQIISQPFGTGYLEFDHKYETDNSSAGGYVELSYDNGNSWINLIEGINGSTNFYSIDDTISGGYPAFNGSSQGWKSSKAYFWWYSAVKKSDSWPPGWGLGMYENPDTLLVRFGFRSNISSIRKQGWLIDNIKFVVYDIAGSTDDLRTEKFTIAHKRPSDVISIIPAETFNERYSAYIVDMNGRRQIIRSNSPNNLDVKHLNSGIYIVCIETDVGIIRTEKVVIW